MEVHGAKHAVGHQGDAPGRGKRIVKGLQQGGGERRGWSAGSEGLEEAGRHVAVIGREADPASRCRVVDEPELTGAGAGAHVP